LCGFVALSLLAQTQQPSAAEQEPPEEDRDTQREHTYVLNPLQADKELSIGKFYLKRGSYRAAVKRFEEAAKWNPSLAEAYLRMGEAYSKAKNDKAAAEAWEKYLELEPDGKDADAIRKKLGKK
jgi:outer membrane protein assembly factor BamD (BamD/ComL family)